MLVYFYNEHVCSTLSPLWTSSLATLSPKGRARSVRWLTSFFILQFPIKINIIDQISTMDVLFMKHNWFYLLILGIWEMRRMKLATLFDLLPRYTQTVISGDFNTYLLGLNTHDKIFLPSMFDNCSMVFLPLQATRHTLK